MIASPGTAVHRAGLTLLEVVISLFIFLFSLIAISSLVNLGTRQAMLAEQKQRAAFLCESKLAELASAVVPLASTSDSPFDDPDTDWTWAADCTQDSTPGLWKVQVTVSKDNGGNSSVSVIMSQWIIDPSVRGSSADSLQAGIAASQASSSSSTTPSGTPGTTTGGTGP